MVEFCEREGVPFEICGKVIVATEESEIPLLERIQERSLANCVRSELIGAERLREIEPHVSGIRAIHVPDAGIVDFPAVCAALAIRIKEKGGRILLGAEVRGVRRIADRLTVETTAGPVETSFLINCAGLQSDRVARMSGGKPSARIVPFRGEYFALVPEAHHLCRNLIYPVPDPAFPFLGVHLTRMIGGGVECGPNAVLAFAREGYTRTDLNPRDLFDSLGYSGLLRLGARHWRAALGEVWRSISKTAFLRSLQRLVPALREEDLVPAPAGVRAQAVDPRGQLIDDFLILEGDRVVNVCNAPSPAATASLNIGDLIADRVAARTLDPRFLGDDGTCSTAR